MTHEVFIRLILAIAVFVGGITVKPAIDLIRGEAGLSARVDHLESQDNKGDRWTAEQQRMYVQGITVFHQSLVQQLYDHSQKCSGDWREVKAMLTGIEKRLDRR